jgi:hypothetical protein
MRTVRFKICHSEDAVLVPYPLQSGMLCLQTGLSEES